MKILIVGSGKLAKAITGAGLSFPGCEILEWSPTTAVQLNEPGIVVHTGSGRQLKEVTEFCERTDSTLIELSTGLFTETLEPAYSLLVCPNTSILLLKILHVLKLSGKYFVNEKISVTESHQQAKTSVPGTAYSFAESLGFPVQDIQSVRDPDIQKNSIGIQDEYLGRHAYHKIIIGDDSEQITIETKVLGHDGYAKGVEKIINAVLAHPLEKRRYSILELIDSGIL